MKTTPECYDCLKRLVRQAATFAGQGNQEIQDKAETEGLKVLDENFSTEVVSIVIATRIHSAIRQASGNPDPYHGMKEREIKLARDVMKNNEYLRSSTFKDLLKLAALGNSIDFFRPIAKIREDMKKPVSFFVDDSVLFQENLEDAKNVLYLADNAGEPFFDLPLLKWLGDRVETTYAVKESPVQNDITMAEMEGLGFKKEFGRVISTGTATPGIDFNQASDRFNQAFKSADLILAKGMGYWESLSELPPKNHIFFCLMAKCQPVADSLGVPLFSYVALLR